MLKVSYLLHYSNMDSRKCDTCSKICKKRNFSCERCSVTCYCSVKCKNLDYKYHSTICLKTNQNNIIYSYCCSLNAKQSLHCYTSYYYEESRKRLKENDIKPITSEQKELLENFVKSFYTDKIEELSHSCIYPYFQIQFNFPMVPNEKIKVEKIWFTPHNDYKDIIGIFRHNQFAPFLTKEGRRKEGFKTIIFLIQFK